MKRLLLAAALLAAAATPAAAGECVSASPTDFAVQFKMHEIVGEPISGLDEFSLKQLGDRHWKLRQVAEWTDTLAPGEVQSCYRQWVVFYLSNVNEEVEARRRSTPHPDMIHAEAQAAGHELAFHLPAPPTK